MLMVTLYPITVFLQDINDFDKFEVPFILLLDSLKAHNKDVIASQIRQWLNFEWKKVMKINVDVFNSQSVQLFTPKGIVIEK